MDGTLDVHVGPTFVLGFGFDHTHTCRCSQRGGGGVGWRA